MITAITIENFKGIAEAITIPIRPITLLFGKNSAGKSTILQAMHYAREILQHRNPDPDKTVRWGQQTWDEMMIGWYDIGLPVAKAEALRKNEKAARDARNEQQGIVVDEQQVLRFDFLYTHAG